MQLQLGKRRKNLEDAFEKRTAEFREYSPEESSAATSPEPPRSQIAKYPVIHKVRSSPAGAIT